MSLLKPVLLSFRLWLGFTCLRKQVRYGGETPQFATQREARLRCAPADIEGSLERRSHWEKTSHVRPCKPPAQAMAPARPVAARAIVIAFSTASAPVENNRESRW